MTMNVTPTGIRWDYSDTAHFNGIPCRVIEGVDIVLDKQGRATAEFVESEEFRMLENAGIEVHGVGEQVS